ncbi:MAG: class I SAM-dependent methyltransferase [Fimbriimonadaceae bacterium]|nr:class I SAM-dependent methyltransferase [Fimbriimonadaceae bacterium]
MTPPRSKSILFDDAFYAYLVDHWVREPDLLRRLREETDAMPNAGMQIGPEQGQLMGLLVKLLGARRCLEVGVFTGYSSLAVALAMPSDGCIVACDVSDEYTSVARRYWAEAGVADRIALHLGPAVETLRTLLEQGQAGTYDFAFVDANKGDYDAYYEMGLKLLRPGGAMLIDNVFWHGRVLDEADQSDDVRAIRDLNAKVRADERVDLAVVPICDGVTLVRKR